jgi:hypothetical protein
MAKESSILNKNGILWQKPMREKGKWGSGFIEQLSKDLREEFPEMTGFSAYNLRFMRIFYKFYSPIWEQVVPNLEDMIMKQVVSQFPKALKMAQPVQQFQMRGKLLIDKKDKIFSSSINYPLKTPSFQEILPSNPCSTALLICFPIWLFPVFRQSACPYPSKA